MTLFCSSDHFTFLQFLLTHKNIHLIEIFNTTFELNIKQLPDIILSSKKLRTYFTIDTYKKQHLFQTVYMMYIKKYYSY